MKLRLLIVVTLLTCNSCTQRKNDNKCTSKENDIIKIDKIDHISIPVPDSLNYELKHQKVICESQIGCLYYGLDPVRNSIDVYNLKLQRLVNSIRYFSDGSPGSFIIDAYYVHRSDSLFLFSGESMMLILVNLENQIRRTWDLKHAMIQLEKKYPGLYLDLIDNDMIFDGGKNVVYFKLSNDRYQLGTGKWFTYPLIASYDIKAGDFVHVFGSFPSENKEKANPLSIAFRLEGLGPNKGLLLNFYNSHRLIEIFENGLTQEFCRQSNYLATIFPEYTTNFADFPSFQNYIIQNGYYTKCLLDYNNKPRVVVVKHAISELSESRPHNAYDASFSLLLFNNGVILGEVPFPPKKYNYFNTQLLGEEFILLDCNNPYNSEVEEGLFEFDVFEINK